MTRSGETSAARRAAAHEAVHGLVQRRIGLLALRRLRWWQREGYPEYVASEP